MEGLTITVEAVGSNSSRRKNFEGVHYTLHNVPRRLAGINLKIAANGKWL